MIIVSRRTKGGTLLQEIEQMVDRAQQGDQHAFAELIRSIHKVSYRLAKSILAKDEDCADAMQEAIIKAYQNLEQLREPKHFKSWFSKILIHQCYRLHSKRKKVISLHETTQQEIPTQAPYERVEFRDLVSRLEEPFRLVVTLYYLEKYSLQEVADILEVPSGTVKSRLYRARQMLQNFLEAKEVNTI